MVILVFFNHCTGYKEFNTHRKYLAKMGDWRNNKDEEVELDGIGGVNILVKADVHRSGWLRFSWSRHEASAELHKESTSHATLSKTKPRRKVSPRWRKGLDIKWLGYQTTLCGISTPRRNKVI